MSDQQNQSSFPLEGLVRGLDELTTVLGPAAAPVVDKVREGLIRAMAQRDQGDRQAALVSIATAMADLTTLGDELGTAEGQAMRMLTAAFTAGLARNDREAVEAGLERIQERAGTPKKE